MHAIERGDIVGPRIVPAGHAIGITGGHCDETGFAPGLLERGPESRRRRRPRRDACKAVRYQIKHGAKVIKICATAGVLSFEGTGRRAAVLRRGAEARSSTRRGGTASRWPRTRTAPQGIIAASNAGVESIEHGSLLERRGDRA